MALFGILGGSAAFSSSASEHDEISRVVNASVAPQQSQPLTVLLMGDSYTAGNGARDDAGNAAYYGPERCMRSTGTWGEQYARIMEGQGYAVTLLNRACSAASTGAMINDRSMRDTRVVTYPEAEPADAPRDDQFYVEWATTEPRCTPEPDTEEYFVSTVNRSPLPDGSARVSVACERWLTAQSAAVNPDVDLVLMTVGGNDVRFPDIARECLIVANADTCADAIGAARNYATEQFADDLLGVFEEISRASEGNTKVGYAAYPGLEVSDDLRITSAGLSGVSTYPVAEQLAALSQEGLEAQRDAVAEANARFGKGFVTLMDEVPLMFDGHEPDARPGFANPDRWMYEFLETTERDEWYHLKPEGHESIAQYAATFGDFGATGSHSPARDLALVVDERDAARSAVESALAEPALWGGARVSVIEQRVAGDGIRVERRVIAYAADPGEALAALSTTSDSPWLPASSVQLQARWNASAQSIFIGDAALSLTDAAPVWSGSQQGRPVSVNAHEVDVPPAVAQGEATAAGPHGAGADLAVLTQSTVWERLVAVLENAANAPHAWAGGPYVALGTKVALTARGSHGPGEVTYAWDLDGDGVFEIDAASDHLRVAPGAVEPGWVSVRVTTPGGSTSVASAWVATAPPAVTSSTPCVTSDHGAGARSQSGRLGCRPDLAAPAVPGSDPVPAAAAPALRITGSATRDTADARGAASDEVGTLAALTLLPMYIDERVAALSGARVRRSSRPDSAGRGRPSELVRREKSLRALLADSAVRR